MLPAKETFGVDKTILPQIRIIQLCHPKRNDWDPFFSGFNKLIFTKGQCLYAGVLGEAESCFQQENRQLLFSYLTPLGCGIGRIPGV